MDKHIIKNTKISGAKAGMERKIKIKINKVEKRRPHGKHFCYKEDRKLTELTAKKKNSINGDDTVTLAKCVVVNNFVIEIFVKANRIRKPKNPLESGKKEKDKKGKKKRKIQIVSHPH